MPTDRIRKLLLATGLVLLATTGTATGMVPADSVKAAAEKSPPAACDWSIKPPNQ